MDDPASDFLRSIEAHHRGKSLEKTPLRWRKAMEFFTSGYDADIAKIVNGAIDPMETEDLVLVSGIEFYSLCEHHLLPFFGKAHVAYVPNGKIIGLSKIPRIVDVFARRLQVQERLGREIADALTNILEPKGVAVMIEAKHLCMMMRGVEKQQSIVTTMRTTGLFKEDRERRHEFLSSVQRGVGG
ncbi:MAG: GTP cyclohydrolase I FolE [Patescibacteria group bacterium]